MRLSGTGSFRETALKVLFRLPCKPNFEYFRSIFFPKMKEKEIRVNFKPQQLVVYVEKEDGSYGQMVTGSYLSKHYLDDFFDKIRKWDKTLKEQLKKGEISPVYYYLIMREFGEGDLASRVGISRRALKKHFTMDGFKQMKLSLVKRYAEAFDIPVSALFHFTVVSEKDAGKLSVSFEESENPYFSLSKIELAEPEKKD